jgi:flagellar basal body-associated protein FliL
MTEEKVESTTESGSKKKFNPVIPIVIIVIVALIGVGGVYAMNYINDLKSQVESKDNGSGLKLESSVFFDEDEAKEHEDNSVKAINVTMNSIVRCSRNSDGQLIANVGLENRNDFQYVVELIEEESNETILRTGLIPAGANVDEVALTKEIEPGDYNVSALFYAVSEEDNETVIGSSGISVELIVS